MLSNTIRRSLSALLIVTAVACGGDKGEEGREIELAPAAGDAAMGDAAMGDSAMPAPAQPAPAPAAVTPAPTPTKAPAKSAAPAPARQTAVVPGSLSAGATITVVAGARICTNTHKVGDRFTATTTEEIVGTGNMRIPVGTEVTLEVVESARGENGTENVKLAFKPVSITLRGSAVPLTADVTQVARLEYERVQSTGTQARKVATGAAVGAVAGQLLGKNTKSTVAGAAIGAAAGGAVAAATTDYSGCLPANGAITVTLSEQLRVR
jgi:hypothetical protein